MVSDMSDWRAVDGIYVPFRSHRVANSITIDRTITEYQVNPTINPELFELPKAKPRPGNQSVAPGRASVDSAVSNNKGSVEAKKPTTLFGIALGKPFDDTLFPQCKQGINSDPCWRPGSALDIENVPDVGEFVQLSTNGNGSSSPVVKIATLVRPDECALSLARLIEKFGKPTEDTKIPMQNGYGAQWDARMITWKLEDDEHSEVLFTSGLQAPADKCMIQATTKTYRDANPAKKSVDF
jgi:hypothetical protein